MIQFPIIIGIIGWILIFIILIFKILLIMKIFNWLKESNRLSHLKVGFAIWALFMLFSLSMCSFFENNVELNNTYGKMMVLLSTFGADFSMLSSMCSVEYAQKLCGNKWDWLDILAGCLPGIILSLIIILVMFI